MLGGLLAENILNYDQLPYFIYILPVLLAVVAREIAGARRPATDVRLPSAEPLVSYGLPTGELRGLAAPLRR
jgi:hypothetical protein